MKNFPSLQLRIFSSEFLICRKNEHLIVIGFHQLFFSYFHRSGYSRIPVFDKSRDNVIGLLFVKDLIFVDPDDETPIRNFIQIFGRGGKKLRQIQLLIF